VCFIHTQYLWTAPRYFILLFSRTGSDLLTHFILSYDFNSPANSKNPCNRHTSFYPTSPAIKGPVSCILGSFCLSLHRGNISAYRHLSCCTCTVRPGESPGRISRRILPVAIPVFIRASHCKPSPSPGFYNKPGGIPAFPVPCVWVHTSLLAFDPRLPVSRRVYLPGKPS
jgi:hypothetical protein